MFSCLQKTCVRTKSWASDTFKDMSRTYETKAVHLDSGRKNDFEHKRLEPEPVPEQDKDKSISTPRILGFCLLDWQSRSSSCEMNDENEEFCLVQLFSSIWACMNEKSQHNLSA